MSVSASLDSHFTASSATSGLDRRAATLQGKGATVVVANLAHNSDKLTSDTVNLSADLSSTAASTPTARLTSSLAQILKQASHVDPATGAREINQGIGDTLASQVGQLLAGAGFSQADATKASASLVQQFASASSGKNVLALSLANQSQSAGGYTASVAGGQEVSAYSVQSTTTLNMAFDLGSGDLSVKLDQHKVAATKIEWSSSTASDVSIALTQPELEAIDFTPDGVKSNATGSPVQESEVTTTQYDSGNDIGSSNVSGPNALKDYLDSESKINASLPPNTGVVTPITDDTKNSFATPLNKNAVTKSSGEAAILALKKIVEQARATFSTENQSANHSVNLSITQKIGNVGTNQDGGKFFLYSRSTGDNAAFNLPGVHVEA